MNKHQFGEGPERQAWFPMVIILHVFEEGSGDDGEDVTSQYEVSFIHCRQSPRIPLRTLLPACAVHPITQALGANRVNLLQLLARVGLHSFVAMNQ